MLMRKALVASAAALALTGMSVGIADAAMAADVTSASSTAVQSYSCSRTYYSGTALTESGDTGNRVIEVQCQLYHRGFLSAGQVDGIFGSITYNAVLRFQREYNSICHGGLSVDGAVGTYTWAALRSACPS
ncbi:peptidoglycan-binding domain-containing protein [Streptomyces javensis]|uniref:Peptidoglycan-binding protein n=1 Tax=Streptomyces javensis TaxID=114698 RepID=A0ABS0R823_9ACTN|nr:peptidoglycan-binding domain-containing protein [Streptomyces javensis]MBI0313562.1 peptidoglycan-binding protein [Streptomyces javensis]